MNLFFCKKAYKNCPPEETVQVIQNIIKDNLGIDLVERSLSDEHKLFYSCRLVIHNEWITGMSIGTNGKGMSETYSRASAYGEMMERIQNGVLFNYIDFATKYFINSHKNDYPEYCETVMQQDAVLQFRYAPDELYSEDNSMLGAAIQHYVLSYNNEELYNLSKDKGHYYVPYFDVLNNSLAYLPVDIIFNHISSNGMCAGNTPAEALVQGISEILERFVIRKIYFENITFPSISHSYFEGTEILKRIRELEQVGGYITTIVDASCGIGIPAIGIIVTDKAKTKYQFHLGVDPSPVVALERTLTELFQGRTEISFKDFDLPYQTLLLSDVKLKEKEIHETFIVSSGHYPISLFYPTASYPFNGFDERWGCSDGEDLQIMINLISELGYKIYVRDNSYLGFPTYSIYVPGMSELRNVYSLSHFRYTYGKYQNDFICSHSLENASKSEMISLLNDLFSNPDNQLALQFINAQDVWMSGNPLFLCGVLYYRTGQPELALRTISQALAQTSNKSQRKLYQCFYDYITLLSNSAHVDHLILCVYDEKMLMAVKQCLHSDDWHLLFNVSSCFNCTKCKIKSSCHYMKYLKLLKSVQTKIMESYLNQLDLKNLFSKS